MASQKEQQSQPSSGAETPTLISGTEEIFNLPHAETTARLSKSGYSSPSSPLSRAGSLTYYDDVTIDEEIYNRVYTHTQIRNPTADFTIRPMKHEGALARSLLKTIGEAFTNEPSELMDLCLKLRSEYLKVPSQSTLQLSMLAGKLALYANLRRGKPQILTPVEYAKYSAELGPVFAEVLKKGKGLATLSTLSKFRLIDLDKKIEEFNDRWGRIFTIDKDRVYSYDEFLNEDNLLFFDDPEVDDIKWANTPLDINEDALYDFRRVLREVLELWKVPDLISPSKSEIAGWTSDSTSFEWEPTERTIHRNIVRDRLRAGHKSPFGELTTDFIMRRSIVPVAPANFRDAWEPSFDTLFTIKSISHVMRQVVQPIPYSAMYDANIAYRRKKKLLDKDSLFLMLDYKKSAITIPRQIVTIMGEELERIYPNKEFSFIKYYESLTLYVEGQVYPTKRGVGLGNMNELYTLMQCVFGHFSKRSFNTGSIFFNDDAAYELDRKRFRKQVILILSFIRSVGCILNFSKCVISESTIFCEEYRTTSQIDYRKIQLLVLPMLGSLFCPNTAVAKRYLYSIDRGLVGTGMQFLTKKMLNILTQVYPAEFGKLDLLLPYHLGGWIDFSSTNFSCVVEYCLDPWQYLTTPNEQGSIPEIRRWIAYHLSDIDKSDSILSSKARISYRGEHILNTEKDFEIFRYQDSLSEYLYGYCGLSTPEEHERTLDDVVNYRGLHNAKPRVKLGLAEKFSKNRYRIYRNFKRFSKERLNLIQCDGLGLNRVLRYIRSMDDSPSYLSFPRRFVKTYENVQKGKRNKIVVYKKSNESYSKSLTNIKKSIAATIDSIRTGQWYYRSDPFIFYDLWRRKKSGYLLSEEGIPNIQGRSYNLPVDFRVFCPNSTLFMREFAVRTGKIPLSWHESTNLISAYQMYMFKDTFEMVLPTDLIGEWREIKELYKKNFYQLRNILSTMNLKHKKSFKAFLGAARELLKEFEDYIPPEIETVDDDILEVLERFEEEHLYEHYVSETYTVEDLLDDESDLCYDFDDAESEESFPVLEFEEFEDDDSEYEDSDPGLNEIRRLARQGMSSLHEDRL
jgi:hypothetical protein